MFVSPLTKGEVKKVVVKIENKTSGYDQIRTETLKLRKISQPLTFLFNQIIANACFPECMNIGK